MAKGLTCSHAKLNLACLFGSRVQAFVSLCIHVPLQMDMVVSVAFLDSTS